MESPNKRSKLSGYFQTILNPAEEGDDEKQRRETSEDDEATSQSYGKLGTTSGTRQEATNAGDGSGWLLTQPLYPTPTATAPVQRMNTSYQATHQQKQHEPNLRDEEPFYVPQPWKREDLARPHLREHPNEPLSRLNSPTIRPPYLYARESAIRSTIERKPPPPIPPAPRPRNRPNPLHVLRTPIADAEMQPYPMPDPSDPEVRIPETRKGEVPVSDGPRGVDRRQSRKDLEKMGIGGNR